MTAAPPAANKALNLRIRGFLFELRETDGRASLRAPHLEGYGAISADFTDAEQRRRIAGGKKQLLAKAVGFAKNPAPHVLDCTGGMGRDAFTLAALGATVTVLERTKVLAHLLENAHSRALADERSQTAAQRMAILPTSAHDFLAAALQQENPSRWNVVYLDPMYPEDGKSALPSKEMQVLRDLSGGDDDADALLPLARACASQRVVVKRPMKAPWLANTKPELSYTGTQARFDVYLPQALQANPPASPLAASEVEALADATTQLAADPVAHDAASAARCLANPED